jgi:hypothetical protein
VECLGREIVGIRMMVIEIRIEIIEIRRYIITL